MREDALEEIARLLGGISEKLDVVVRSLSPDHQREVAESLGMHIEGIPAIPISRAPRALRTEGYPPLMSAGDAEKAAREARDAAQRTEALVHRATFGTFP